MEAIHYSDRSRDFTREEWDQVCEYTECDEVADNMPLPAKQLTFDEALAIVRVAMPDESAPIISNWPTR